MKKKPNKLKQLRFLNGLTQSEMAKLIGISRAQYSAIELKKVGLNSEYLKRIQLEFCLTNEEIGELINE